ncbi:hypothetical protein BDZ91DRAFT_492375 [Kalaharituber pfeilii]|nr:hypothetical protein BDZ91DRAFT_492375 [Kalaharituber pfeilii]
MILFLGHVLQLVILVERILAPVTLFWHKHVPSVYVWSICFLIPVLLKITIGPGMWKLWRIILRIILNLVYWDGRYIEEKIRRSCVNGDVIAPPGS